jgi:hypothetical protein
MTKAEAASLIASLVTAFPSARFATENAEMYESGISDLDAKETQAAIGELIHSSRYLPTIAEIRGEVMRARREAVRLSEGTSKILTGAAAGGTIGPRPGSWAPVLTRMLEASSRHRAMAKAWYERHGKPVPRDPDAEFVELCQSGASGEDIRGKARAAGITREDFGETEELERRYP